MKITIRRACVSPDDMPFDVAERKGIGHPDSLADLIADTFSQRYATWCLRQFGLVPNHWVDKVTLVGAVADVTYGRFDIHAPAGCHLIGKITDQLGSASIPIEEIFQDTLRRVLPSALGDSRILDHIRPSISNTRGVAVDHDRQFYLPRTADELAKVLVAESVVNDTVVCVGTAARGLAADIVVRLERIITSEGFRTRVAAVGTDVKVMAVRVAGELDITVAVPFHPERVGSWNEYRAGLAEVQSAVSAELKLLLDQDPRAGRISGVSLQLNTKDSHERGYLAPFGTSLGKGDCGAVGRGNRYRGAIEPLRPASGEAPAGKNPVHHGGKIYTAVAADAAQRILADTSMYAEVIIAARNGGALTEPAHVLVALDRDVDATTAATIDGIVRWSVAGALGFRDRFMAAEPIVRFRGEARP